MTTKEASIKILELKKMYKDWILLANIKYIDYLRKRDESNLTVREILTLEREVEKELKNT